MSDFNWDASNMKYKYIMEYKDNIDYDSFNDEYCLYKNKYKKIIREMLDISDIRIEILDTYTNIMMIITQLVFLLLNLRLLM